MPKLESNRGKSSAVCHFCILTINCSLEAALLEAALLEAGGQRKEEEGRSNPPLTPPRRGRKRVFLHALTCSLSHHFSKLLRWLQSSANLYKIRILAALLIITPMSATTDN